MKICVFCGDAFMSGANMALKDWIEEDKSNEYWLFVPRKTKDFEGFSENIHVVSGKYFATTKFLRSLSLKERVKLLVKRFYMQSLYSGPVRNRLKKIIKTIAPDVVISNTFSVWIGADIAISLGIPHIWYIREFMELDHNITHEDSNKIRKLVSESNAIFISKAIENYYLNVKKYSFKKTKVVYDKITLDKNIHVKFDKFVTPETEAIFVGQLAQGKGVLDAVKAAKQVYEDGYNFSLDIYGKGPQEVVIKDYIRDNNILNVHLKGYTTRVSAQRPIYDIALVCSKMEALGRVTLEAMYYGNLVIGADSGGTKELVQDNVTGYLYQSGNINSLVEIIENTIDKGTQNIVVMKRAREWAIQNFSSSIEQKITSFIVECKA